MGIGNWFQPNTTKNVPIVNRSVPSHGSHASSNTSSAPPARLQSHQTQQQEMHGRASDQSVLSSQSISQASLWADNHPDQQGHYFCPIEQEMVNITEDVILWIPQGDLVPTQNHSAHQEEEAEIHVAPINTVPNDVSGRDTSQDTWLAEYKDPRSKALLQGKFAPFKLTKEFKHLLETNPQDPLTRKELKHSQTILFVTGKGQWQKPIMFHLTDSGLEAFSPRARVTSSTTTQSSNTTGYYDDMRTHNDAHEQPTAYHSHVNHSSHYSRTQFSIGLLGFRFKRTVTQRPTQQAHRSHDFSFLGFGPLPQSQIKHHIFSDVDRMVNHISRGIRQDIRTQQNQIRNEIHNHHRQIASEIQQSHHQLRHNMHQARNEMSQMRRGMHQMRTDMHQQMRRDHQEAMRHLRDPFGHAHPSRVTHSHTHSSSNRHSTLGSGMSPLGSFGHSNFGSNTFGSNGFSSNGFGSNGFNSNGFGSRGFGSGFNKSF